MLPTGTCSARAIFGADVVTIVPSSISMKKQPATSSATLRCARSIVELAGMTLYRTRSRFPTGGSVLYRRSLPVHRRFRARRVAASWRKKSRLAMFACGRSSRDEIRSARSAPMGPSREQGTADESDPSARSRHSGRRRPDAAALAIRCRLRLR